MERGSSSSAGGGSDSLNGLKFGKKIYFEGMGSNTGGGSPSSPAKKGKTGVVHGGGPPRCQVEGCKVDLSDAKAYYSRHKVCCIHSKAENVIVAGIIQRFCQQCSRFHKKTEFDDGKRSCRRRLACHNERRRKPPPGTIMSSSPHYATLSPTTSLSPNLFDTHSKTGSFVMDFSRSYPSLTGRESWPHTTTNLELANQLPWQTNSPTNPSPNYLQGSINRPSFSAPGVNSVDSFNGVSDSSSALSLLSIQPWAGSRTRSTSLEVNNFLGSNGATTIVQPSLNPGQFAYPAWMGFKENETNTGLNEMRPDLGLGQIAHQGNNIQYTSGELGLGQPSEGRFNGLDHSRGYDSFV